LAAAAGGTAAEGAAQASRAEVKRTTGRRGNFSIDFILCNGFEEKKNLN